jgi:hypothetical protein
MRARTTEVKSSASSCMKLWGNNIPVLGKSWLRANPTLMEAGRSRGAQQKRMGDGRGRKTETINKTSV